jgi:hypothetical protein
MLNPSKSLLLHHGGMSALPPKADMGSANIDAERRSLQNAISILIKSLLALSVSCAAEQTA